MSRLHFLRIAAAAARGSCSPCSHIEVVLNGITAGGRAFPIDEFVANQTNNDSFPFASKTSTFPARRCPSDCARSTAERTTRCS